MEHMALGLVLLAATLATGNPPRHQDHGAIVEVPLDMAPNSFDDQYRGCSRRTGELLVELNRTEFAKKNVYAEAWTLAITEWRSRQSRQGHIPQTPALRMEQAVALLTYTQQGRLYKEFNVAVREAGRSREQYLDGFHFKTLHFLLSEALRLLRDTQTRRCHHVYRGVRGIRFITQKGQTIRFGQFTSSSLDYNRAQFFGNDTFFSVVSCYGVAIQKYSYFPSEEEVLIPPFEVFEVTAVVHNGDRAHIHLCSYNTSSTYNCVLAKG
ncbi:NARE ribosyltransferase, partial [Bucorvus abyssinicus]|nr:NARE ribosyltransferase [Bucorvus abyssinicus]